VAKWQLKRVAIFYACRPVQLASKISFMKRKHFVFCMLMLVFCWQANAQHREPQVRQFDLSSQSTGQEYTLFVSIPKTYKAYDSMRYPVLYVLDGNFMFPVMSQMQQLLQETREVKDLIIVGIGYHTHSILGSTPYRTPDYTPTRDTSFENMLARDIKMEVRTGGANRFVRALKNEIFPFIERNFRTSERGLAGHSFGGLLGTYVLVNEPQLFRRYLLSSVSFFWDNKVLLQQEEAFFKKGNKTLAANVFITVGEQEQYMGMIPLMQQFIASVKEHRYAGLTLESRVLPHETHASAFFTSFNQGLRVLYKK
jgi:hypothetical protein